MKAPKQDHIEIASSLLISHFILRYF